MKHLAVWTEAAYQKDSLFDPLSPMNRDEVLSPFRALKNACLVHNWDIHTQDIYFASGISPEIVLFLDIPRLPVDILLRRWGSRPKKYVILQECEIIKSRNWDKTLHSSYDRIFTWADALVDNLKYFKLNFAQTIKKEIPGGFAARKKLCTLIAGNKKRSHPFELYSKRVEAIRWFEFNYPEDFEFYGVGWDKYVFSGGRPMRFLNKLSVLNSFRRSISPAFPSYRGTVDSKFNAFVKYRFSICYENAQQIPGYITEKIFDSFFAGCVPVYWGAPDISLYIPETCFVDRRNFKNYDELYAFMKNMSETEWEGMLNEIRRFLGSNASYQFSDVCFADTLLKVILNER